MKKLSILAFSLMTLASVTTFAQTDAKTQAVASTQQDAKTSVKPEELPAAIQKTLSTDAYKGWTVSSANMVKSKVDYYEVSLMKDKETKMIKFDKEGTILE
ncbi:MAG: hypothetical protein JWP12_2162 [Bacteroidetes bacterium]|nr:hypothetical protein [Bacteroidota bacterium]